MDNNKFKIIRQLLQSPQINKRVGVINNKRENRISNKRENRISNKRENRIKVKKKLFANYQIDKIDKIQNNLMFTQELI